MNSSKIAFRSGAFLSRRAIQRAWDRYGKIRAARRLAR